MAAIKPIDIGELVRRASERVASGAGRVSSGAKKQAKRGARGARKILTPERCQDCGALFTWRDIAYGAWAHSQCKRCHGHAERRHVNGWDHYVVTPARPMNRANRRIIGRAVAGQRAHDARWKSPRRLPVAA